MYNETAELRALWDSGLIIESIINDEDLHRVPTINKPNSRNGWYVAHRKTIIFGDWQTGLKQTLRRANYQLSTSTLALRKEQKVREFNKWKKQNEMALVAKKIFEDAKFANENYFGHKYLIEKGLKFVNTVKVSEGTLMVPLVELKTNELRSLQLIQLCGSKQFLAGGQVKGLCHPIGQAIKGICVCEGYATAVSIAENENMQLLVLAAMNANNLKEVAQKARQCFPRHKIIVAADDDYKTFQKTGINPGMEHALKAAESVAGEVWSPPFDEEQKIAGLTDWNDYYNIARRRA